MRQKLRDGDAKEAGGLQLRSLAAAVNPHTGPELRLKARWASGRPWRILSLKPVPAHLRVRRQIIIHGHPTPNQSGRHFGGLFNFLAVQRAGHGKSRAEGAGACSIRHCGGGVAKPKDRGDRLDVSSINAESSPGMRAGRARAQNGPWGCSRWRKGRQRRCSCCRQGMGLSSRRSLVSLTAASRNAALAWTCCGICERRSDRGNLFVKRAPTAEWRRGALTAAGEEWHSLEGGEREGWTEFFGKCIRPSLAHCK